MFRLSPKEKILVHLEDHVEEQLGVEAKKLEPELIFSQSGIEEAINLSHRLVSEGLKELKKADLIEEKRIYLRETGRFRNFYFLTSEGILKAKELKDQLGKIKLRVRDRAETKEMKILDLVEHLEKIFKEPIGSGYSYIIKGEKHDKAYQVFKNLLERGYEGVVISNMPPKNIEKEYEIKAEIYWLSEVEGENVLKPERLEFEIMATISNFLKEAKRPVILLEGFEWLSQTNGFDTCLKWIKTVNDVVAKNNGILLLPLNPVVFSEKEFSLLSQSMKLYEPREITPVEVNYTNLIRNITPGGFLDLRTLLEPKRYVDFSDRKPELRYFVDREKELKELNDFINSRSKFLVIKGIAGIGKTVLVAKALELYKPKMNIFWHRFYKLSVLRSMLIKLAEFLAELGKEKLKNYLAIGRIDPEEIMMILEEELSAINTLLVFDNFERASAEIVDFFSLLKDLRSDLKIVVIGRGIAPFYDRRDVRVKKSVVEMTVGCLDRAGSEKLLKYRGLEKDIDRFYNLTKGHPLMLELILPETAIEAEEFLKEEILRALNEREKRCLGLASVFRFPFYPRALFIEDIDYDTIDALVEKSLLQRSANVYDLHEMLRDFFYSRLTTPRKREYHELVARYYEEEGVGTALIEAMHHNLRSSNHEKAGKLAVENGSAIIRAGYLEEFISVLAEFKLEEVQKEQHAKLLIFKGDIANLLGKWDDALKYYQLALELSSELKNDAYLAEAYRGIAKIYFPRAEYDRALENLHLALNISEQINDIHGIADVHYNIGSVCLRRGELNEAMKAFKLGLDFCHKIGDEALMAKTSSAMGVVYWSMGEYDKCIELMRKALEETKRIDDKHELARIYNNLGTAHDRRGELDKAIEWFEECVKISNKIGDVRLAGYGLSNAAEGYARKSNLSKAKKYTASALRTFERLGEKRAIAQCELNYGVIYRAEREWSKAIEHFEKAIKLAKETGDQEFPSQIYFEYGKMYKAREMKEEAKQLFENAITAYEKLGNVKKVEEVKKELQEL